MLALLATVFGQYFNLVMTADQTIVAVIVILVFSCISYFGVSIGALVQNVMVIVLVIALGVYIALGLPNVSPEFFTLGKAISFENVDFLSFGAALGLIASCLMGGYVGVNYAEQVKNPGKNVILAFLFSTVIVGIIIAVTQFIPALRVRKRYPLCYKNAPIKLPTGLIYCLIVVALGFCIYEAYSLITTSSGMVWIALIATIVLCYGYYFGRIAYLRRKGIDLIAIMSAPYEPWEQKELEYAAKERS